MWSSPFDTQKLADFLEKPGLKLGALVNVDVGGGPVLGKPAGRQGVSHRGGHGENLHELGKEVVSYQDVFVASACLGKGVHDVDTKCSRGSPMWKLCRDTLLWALGALCFTQVLQGDMKRWVSSFILGTPKCSAVLASCAILKATSHRGWGSST